MLGRHIGHIPLKGDERGWAVTLRSGHSCMQGCKCTCTTYTCDSKSIMENVAVCLPIWGMKAAPFFLSALSLRGSLGEAVHGFLNHATASGQCCSQNK